MCRSIFGHSGGRMKALSAGCACLCIIAASFCAIGGDAGDLVDARSIGSGSLPEALAATNHVADTRVRAPTWLSAPGSGTADGVIGRNDRATAYGRLPIRFEPNRGQAPPEVKYLAHDAGYSIALTDDGAILGLASTRSGLSMPSSQDRVERLRTAFLRVGLVGANPRPRMSAEQRQGSVSNYFIGSDASMWHRDLPNYAAVRYRQVYPGIDWVVYGNPRQLEYDLEVAPHADPGTIRFDFARAYSVALDAGGDLLIDVGELTIRQLKPVVYQRTASGRKQFVEAAYVVDGRQVALAIGGYDRDRALVVDPVITYSTYLGGSGEIGSGYGDTANAIAVDRAGNAYLAGRTYSMDFPLAGPVQSKNKAGASGTAFVAKLNAEGSALLYATYLGGSGDDFANAIAVDAKGCAYVAGTTLSKDFPVVRPLQRELRGYVGSNGFVAKLDPAGHTLVYSTYLGGGTEDATAIAVDGDGSAYVAGNTRSADFPIVHAFQKIWKGGGSDPSAQSWPDGTPIGKRQSTPADRALVNAFVAKLAPAGDSLVYSTFLGGSGRNGNKNTAHSSDGDQANAIAVDAAGNAYVAGSTSSDDFPILHPLQARNRSGITGFVTKLDAAGKALVWSTFLGGRAPGDKVNAITLDDAGNVYVGGVTHSRDFPTVHPFQASNKAPAASNCDRENELSGKRQLFNCGTGFVAELKADGSKLLFSSYLGGSGRVDSGVDDVRIGTKHGFRYRDGFGDAVTAIALDKAHDVVVAGFTASRNFPLAEPVQAVPKPPAQGYRAAPFGIVDAGFVSRLRPDGRSVSFSTYLGGSVGNEIGGVATDAAGIIYVAGNTSSDDFPTVHALQHVNLGYLQEYRNYAAAHGLPQPRFGLYTDGGGPSSTGENAFVAKIDVQAAAGTTAPRGKR
jgi:hypothetical protein